jgi:hypothetical protein
MVKIPKKKKVIITGNGEDKQQVKYISGNAS